jgi:predicted RecB family nuclease
MNVKITRDILESHLSCKVKSFLRLAGQQGTRSDYETVSTELRGRVRLQAIDKILAQHREDDVERNAPVTPSVLKRGAAFILDPIMEDSLFSLAFDGLKRVVGPSKMGEFHYVPMLFHGGRRIGKTQRRMLDLYAVLLSRLQGQVPGYGIVYHGRECRATRVHLNADLRKAEHLLDELKEQCDSASLPKLILNAHCHACEFRQRCHTQAVQEDNLSLLRGMGEKEIKRCNRKGLFTVTQLAHTFRPRRTGKRVQRRSPRRYHALQALAVRDKRIYVLGTPEVCASPIRIYLDIEGNPDVGAIYLIGMIIDAGGAEKRYSFWADETRGEKQIFEQFLSAVGQYDNLLLFCYGGYERVFLTRMGKRPQMKKAVDRVLKNLVNTLTLIYAHVYFPTYSNGLKDIGGYLGCSWTDPNASGTESIAWRMRWEAGHDEVWKRKLMVYNMEDCAALKRVTEVIYAIAGGLGSGEQTAPSGLDGLPVSRVQDIDELTRHFRWGRVKFVHPDFEHINNCAYFDYQRERVYVRSSRVLRRREAKRGGHCNRRLRVTRRLQIESSRCPTCGSKAVVEATGKQVKCWKPRVKRAFDLVFTQGGMRRKVIESQASVHECLSCGTAFVPERHERLDKHFHGLKSWAMYQHIAHRLSFGTIESMLEEVFGLRVYSPEFIMFKSLMARYYQPTYRRLLRKILCGNLLHVDETEVKLRGEKGYVWVFTSLEEVVFMYRPTREGDFLQKLLENFRGVLVSDFYAAYDSLDCPQQKCLIHLMRDMNQELLRNPYDEELQSMTRPFGTLLRAIIETVDEHGLKCRYLKRHEREVENYFQLLSARLFRSDAAEGLQRRFLKYRDKLFTFLRHDGVPWNNNNAENAIKRFAYYRQDTVGIMKESGLIDYLVLLSICHTCRYKGISFLKFLLSRERDLDVFCGGKRLTQRSPTVEVYPRGFVPPHLPRRRSPLPSLTDESEWHCSVGATLE